MAVMALVGLVLDGGGVNCDTTGLLFGGLINLAVLEVLCELLLRQHLRDGRGQRRLAVVNMADGAHVKMGLVPDEFRERVAALGRKTHAEAQRVDRLVELEETPEHGHPYKPIISIVLRFI